MAGGRGFHFPWVLSLWKAAEPCGWRLQGADQSARVTCSSQQPRDEGRVRQRDITQALLGRLEGFAASSSCKVESGPTSIPPPFADVFMYFLKIPKIFD